MSIAVMPKNEIQAKSSPVSSQLMPTRLPWQEVWELAGHIANSKIAKDGFTPATQAQVFALMLLAEADGIAYIDAVRRYDIIEGKPAKKAATLLAEFQAKGGSVVWKQFDEDGAEGVFSHPRLQPEPIKVRLTYEDANRRGITASDKGEKKNWRCHRASMLLARVSSFAVNMIDPSIKVGLLTTEEAGDWDQSTFTAVGGKTIDVDSYVNNPPKMVDPEVSKPPQAVDVPVYGWRGTGHDTRSYLQIAKEAVSEFNSQLAAIYTANKAEVPKEPYKVAPVHYEIYKLAFEAGKTATTATTNNQILAVITESLYQIDRQWVREQLTAHLKALLEKVEADFEIAADDGESEGREPSEDG